MNFSAVRLLWLVCMSLAALPQSADAQAPERLIGKARIVDGDTIDIGSTRIRLWGIDAPESKQQCAIDSRQYACGREATNHLAALIGTLDVTCTHKTRDRYGRVVAICLVGVADIGAEMVRSGWALAFVRYSSDYVAQEQEARANGRGLWGGTFEDPSAVRRR